VQYQEHLVILNVQYNLIYYILLGTAVRVQLLEEHLSGEAAKSAERERGDPSPAPRAGKRQVPTSGSSDSVGVESSVTAVKPPHG